MEKNLKGKQDVKYQGRGGLQSEIGWSWRDKETSFLEKKKKKKQGKKKLPCRYLRESIPGRGNRKNKVPLRECARLFIEKQGDQYGWNRIN